MSAVRVRPWPFVASAEPSLEEVPAYFHERPLLAARTHPALRTNSGEADQADDQQGCEGRVSSVYLNATDGTQSDGLPARLGRKPLHYPNQTVAHDDRMVYLESRAVGERDADFLRALLAGEPLWLQGSRIPTGARVEKRSGDCHSRQHGERLA